MSRLPKATAALLPNKTYPYPDDEGYYVALLAVFHNLHCLVLIQTFFEAFANKRRTSYEKLYSPSTTDGTLHQTTTGSIPVTA